MTFWPPRTGPRCDPPARLTTVVAPPQHRPTAALLNFLYLSLGHVFYKVAALLTLILLARWLGSGDFGRYLIALAAAQLAIYVTDLGIDQALVQDTAGRSERLPRDLAGLIPMRCGLALATVVISVLFVFTARDDPALVEVGLWMGIAHALASLTTTARSIFQALEKMEYEALSLALDGWVRLGAILYAIIAGFGLLGIAKILALASFVVLSATILVIFHRFVRSELTPHFARGWELLRIGLPFWLVWSMLLSDQRANLLLLARLAGDAQVAAFGAAMRLVEPALIIPSALALTLFPVAVRHDRDQVGSQGVLLVWTQKALLLTGLPLMLLIVLGAPLLIRVVFGSGFSAAEQPLRILGPTLVLLFLRIGLTQVLLAAGRWRSALSAQALGLATDLTVALATIPLMAETGAAMAALAGNLVAVAVAWYALRDRVEPGSIGELARTLVPAAAAGALGLAVLSVSVPVALLVAMITFALAIRIGRVLSARDAEYVRRKVPRLAFAVSLASGRDE